MRKRRPIQSMNSQSNMKKITSEQLKQIELDILISLDDYCRKNGLNYFLCGGSCIGAVRHNGFIPWDDDIDIAMPRKDYDIFVKNFSHAKYRVLTGKNRRYFLPFAKVVSTDTIILERNVETTPDMGVFVDVFPIDGLGTNYNKALRHIEKTRNLFLKTLRGIWKPHSIYKPKNLIKLAEKVYFYLFRTLFLTRIDKRCRRYRYEDSDFCGVAFGFYGKNEIMEKEYFDGYELRVFEGCHFRIPKRYDDYLKTMYGEYMKLPPLDKQKTHHSFDAYWKE